MKGYLKYYIALAICAGITACANIKPPTGGPKDMDPPVVDIENSTPNAMVSTNFKSKYLELNFNENIKALNLYKELIVTPPIDQNFKTDVFGKTFKMEFKTPLEDNTTYTFNFGKCIVDATEGNPAENLILTFSTGDKIDSLRITGSVIDNLTNLPVDKAIVGLYKTSDTLTILNSKPYYYTFTDAKGNFNLPYIKSDKYQIYALVDTDNNYYYNQGSDKISFLKEPIQLTKNIDSLEFRVFKEAKKEKLIVTSVKQEGIYQYINFNKNFTLVSLKTSDSVYYESKNKKLKLYNLINKKDSINVQLQAKDSLNEMMDTTFKFVFAEVEAKKIKKENLQISFTSDPKGFSDDSLIFDIVFSKPVHYIDLDSLYIYSKTDTLNLLEDKNISYKLNQEKNKLSIVRTKNIDNSYLIVCKKGAFISIEDDTSSVTNKLLSKVDPENYGYLEAKILTDETNFIAELLNEKGNITRTFVNKKDLKIKLLDASSYTFRILVDENKDGKYEYGNSELKILPEKILFPKEIVKIKANWEIFDVSIKP